MQNHNDMTMLDNDELLALAKLDLAYNPTRLDDALCKIKRILASKTPVTEAYAIAGRIYAQLNLYDKAKSAFQSYLDKQPDALAETFQLGMVNYDQGENDTAARIWSALLERDPTFPPALFYMALIHANNNVFDQARHSLDILLKSAATDNLYFGRGRELLKQIEQGNHLSLIQESAVSSKASTVLAKDAYKSVN